MASDPPPPPSPAPPPAPLIAFGDSFVAKTRGSLTTLANLQLTAAPGVLGRVRAVTLYAPDGSEGSFGGIAIVGNTVTVKVGPNKTAGFPLPPGSWLTLEWVDPALVAIDDGGTSGQQVFVAYGGSGP